jgi:hypothetical protein
MLGLLTSSKGPTIVRQERLDGSDNDQSSDLGSSSLLEQFDPITEPINMGLLKVKDILRQKNFCSAYAKHILGIS